MLKLLLKNMTIITITGVDKEIVSKIASDIKASKTS